MYQAFFPDPIYGWVFCGGLLALLVVAAVIDLRRMIVPKWLTLTVLALGLAANVVRGAWLGVAGAPVWVLSGGSAWIGGLDGFLFALAGFAFGFLLFFTMWILGACGGGDVKLFAALAAWLGPWLVLCVLIVSVGVVLLLSVGRLLTALVGRGATGSLKAFSARGGRPADGGRRPRQRLLSYSLPLAVSTALVLPWAFRVDLGLAPFRPAPGPEVTHHAP
jgi:prepilin peptidase CpaA